MNHKFNLQTFKTLPISVKLRWMIILSSTVALVLAGLAIIIYDSFTYRQQRINDLAIQGEILSAISSAAVVFNDTKSAHEYLSSMRVKPSVVAAAIYDNAGRLFASYHRDDIAELDTSPTQSYGYRIENDDIILFRRITQGNEVIGSIYLRANLELQQRVVRYAIIVLGLFILSLIGSLLLSARLQTFISKPLLEVTQAAQQVIRHHDYSTRQIQHSGDEIGVLVDAFNKMLAQIEQREAALQAANTALQMEIAEHEDARDQVAQLNQTLEQRVIQRTAELEAVNKELESFSYSVSHDLRTPLRGIDGFTAILLEKYREKLDSEGHHYLDRVRAATQRMSHLIDDLLQLSRTTRSEIHFSMVNLSELARIIVDDLIESAPERNVEFSIEPDMKIRADPTLMRVVLENLIGNAWKFTSKQLSAKIEISCTIMAGKKTYFIRDNGPGFDMRYAEKLFGAFQRLHSINEFEGSGVGLANVQRIIHRHNGQIWADAKPGAGATFYFTLSAWRKIA